MKATNLPTDLLRSFVAVSDHGGYTKAGAILGRTQPAISLQMRRLEDLLGKKLFAQKGRNLALTADGVALSIYARQILRLNDEAVAKFNARPREGQIKIGVPSDYCMGQLQDAVVEFVREHAKVTVSIDNAVSPMLLDRLASDDLDIAVAVSSHGASRHLVQTWLAQLVWVMAKGAELYRRTPVPLAVLPENSEYRKRMIVALNSESKPWRIAHSSYGLFTLLNAVRAGIGVTAIPGHARRDDLRILTEADGFPPLERVYVGLFYKHDRLSEAGLELVDRLQMRLDRTNGPSALPAP